MAATEIKASQRRGDETSRISINVEGKWLKAERHHAASAIEWHRVAVESQHQTIVMIIMSSRQTIHTGGVSGR